MLYIRFNTVLSRKKFSIFWLITHFDGRVLKDFVKALETSFLFMTELYLIILVWFRIQSKHFQIAPKRSMLTFLLRQFAVIPTNSFQCVFIVIFLRLLQSPVTNDNELSHHAFLLQKFQSYYYHFPYSNVGPYTVSLQILFGFLVFPHPYTFI